MVLLNKNCILFVLIKITKDHHKCGFFFSIKLIKTKMLFFNRKGCHNVSKVP